jgi:hypothetical protein
MAAGVLTAAGRFDARLVGRVHRRAAGGDVRDRLWLGEVEMRNVAVRLHLQMSAFVDFGGRGSAGIVGHRSGMQWREGIG